VPGVVSAFDGSHFVSVLATFMSRRIVVRHGRSYDQPGRSALTLGPEAVFTSERTRPVVSPSFLSPRLNLCSNINPNRAT
jgi:hypothetical protein